MTMGTLVGFAFGTFDEILAERRAGAGHTRGFAAQG